MAYIIECYANMRGTFFVLHLKCNSRNQIHKLAISQATRTKVAQAVYCTKVVADLGGCDSAGNMENNNGVFECDTTPEYKVLWESAKDCVFELADKEKRIVLTSNSNY
jgi:hypothetical protein